MNQKVVIIKFNSAYKAKILVDEEVSEENSISASPDVKLEETNKGGNYKISNY